MKPFRLQSVLEHRKRREDELQQRLANATAARTEAETRLHMLIDEQRRQRDTLAAKLAAGPIDAREVKERAYLLDSFERAVEQQRDDVARRAAFEEEERARLTVAVQERKALDLLRERHEERERSEEIRRDGLVLEEIASAARIRLTAMAMAAERSM
jgi:flagellar export protein FliJ